LRTSMTARFKATGRCRSWGRATSPQPYHCPRRSTWHSGMLPMAVLVVHCCAEPVENNSTVVQPPAGSKPSPSEPGSPSMSTRTCCATPTSRTVSMPVCHCVTSRLVPVTKTPVRPTAMTWLARISTAMPTTRWLPTWRWDELGTT